MLLVRRAELSSNHCRIGPTFFLSSKNPEITNGFPHFQLIVSACLVATAYAQHQNQPIDYDLEDKLKRSTTTWIPILEYNKEQGDDGSYKTS